MGFNCGIVGLPNVGKSTLFNALTQTAVAQAANYPFCTIEPNVGRVAVPDARLDTLTRIGKSQKTVPTSLEFVDIAGLVRGASKGEGLGNQFLANIREVDAIVHVLRCFEDGDVTHVEGSIDPIRDAETVFEGETEDITHIAPVDHLRVAANARMHGHGYLGGACAGFQHTHQEDGDEDEGFFLPGHRVGIDLEKRLAGERSVGGGDLSDVLQA